MTIQQLPSPWVARPLRVDHGKAGARVRGRADDLVVLSKRASPHTTPVNRKDKVTVHIPS